MSFDFVFVNCFGYVQYQDTLNKAIKRIIRYTNFNALDKNPSIFPATVEWYNILKNVYPDLKPPKTNIRILLSRKTTEYYEIEIEESDPNLASNIARKMLEDSAEGFKLISKDSRVSLREWEEKND